MIFDRISNTHQRIERIREKIFVLETQVCTPKSGEITGMPKDGSGAGNSIELYLERKEKLEAQLNALNERFQNLWEKTVRLMKAANIDSQTRALMYLRFIKHLQWEKCNLEMQKKYPDSNWNINKCFRKYREVRYKIRKLQK